MNLALLTLAPLLGWVSSDLRVDTDSPDALCPEIEVTRKAVVDRLGTVEVEGGSGWHARYTIVHAPGGKRGDVVRLILVDPAGKTQLERDLPMSGESCTTIAQAIALVLERFFRELGQSTRPERELPAPTQAPATQPGPAPGSEVARPQRRVEPSPAKREPPWAFEWALGMGWEALPAGLVGSFELGFAFDRWRTRLRASWPPTSKSEPIGPGEAQLVEWAARLSWERVFARGPWNLSLGPELFVGFDHASTARLESPRSRRGATLGSGAAFGIRYWVLPHFGIGLGFSLDAVLFSGPEYAVSGTRVLDLPRWRGSGVLQFAGAVGP